MIDHMSKILDGEISGESLKKPVKPQDLVRLYETIIQNLADMPQLAGLDEDLGFKHEVSQVFPAAYTFYWCTSVLPTLRVAILPTFRVAILPTAFLVRLQFFRQLFVHFLSYS